MSVARRIIINNKWLPGMVFIRHVLQTIKKHAVQIQIEWMQC